MERYTSTLLILKLHISLAVRDFLVPARKSPKNRHGEALSDMPIVPFMLTLA